MRQTRSRVLSFLCGLAFGRTRREECRFFLVGNFRISSYSQLH
jgi:hypothetical protein